MRFERERASLFVFALVAGLAAVQAGGCVDRPPFGRECERRSDCFFKDDRYTCDAVLRVCVPDPDGNQEPVVEQVADQVVQEGDLFTLDLPFFDPDGEPVEVFAFLLPPGAELDVDDGVAHLRWQVPLGHRFTAGPSTFVDLAFDDGNFATRVGFNIDVRVAPGGLCGGESDCFGVPCVDVSGSTGLRVCRPADAPPEGCREGFSAATFCDGYPCRQACFQIPSNGGAAPGEACGTDAGCALRVCVDNVCRSDVEWFGAGRSEGFPDPSVPGCALPLIPVYLPGSPPNVFHCTERCDAFGCLEPGGARSFDRCVGGQNYCAPFGCSTNEECGFLGANASCDLVNGFGGQCVTGVTPRGGPGAVCFEQAHCEFGRACGFIGDFAPSSHCSLELTSGACPAGHVLFPFCPVPYEGCGLACVESSKGGQGASCSSFEDCAGGTCFDGQCNNLASDWRIGGAPFNPGLQLPGCAAPLVSRSIGEPTPRCVRRCASSADCGNEQCVSLAGESFCEPRSCVDDASCPPGTSCTPSPFSAGQSFCIEP
jgi:hypothetical protein